jgi:ASC-1-like (ASCH) protein
MRHTIKILSEYFEAVCDGRKTFEIRKNDRNYQVGDELLMHECIDSREHGFYETGGWIIAKVKYMTNYAQKDDYVVMGIEIIDSQGGFMYSE